MNCPWSDCGKEITADDAFCPWCGRKVADAPAAAAASPTYVTEASQVGGVSQRPVQQGTYSAQITRRNPACLILLLDQSGSMEEPMAGGGGHKKKDLVTDAINRLLYNTVLRCTKSEERPWPYFDIGIWTYGGNREVRKAFDTDLVSIADVPDRVARTTVRKRRVSDGAGGVFEEEMQFPIWIEPGANGLTPMATAFQAIVGPLQSWIAQYPGSFPPIILNLTDGAYTDESPAATVWQIMNMRTSDGGALVFNCHISQQEGLTQAFPDKSSAAALTGLSSELYEMSSTLPDPMLRMAAGKGYSLQPDSRGYVFNADIVTMIDFLDIGTQAVQDRMEVVAR